MIHAHENTDTFMLQYMSVETVMGLLGYQKFQNNGNYLYAGSQFIIDDDHHAFLSSQSITMNRAVSIHNQISDVVAVRKQFVCHIKRFDVIFSAFNTVSLSSVCRFKIVEKSKFQQSKKTKQYILQCNNVTINNDMYAPEDIRYAL